MCGFVGFVGELPRDAEGLMIRAGQAIQHRGPDDFGVWVDSSAGVALSHRRLSIQDLSPAGHQPMQSRCGRWVIAFNGEIYNHLELRARLSPDAADANSDRPHWRGHSDTETLLECISAWGLGCTLERAEGMFAFALWDRLERCLHLARDRMGEKPLYFGWVGQGLAFASELKAMRILPGFDSSIDRDALALYMEAGAIPAPRTIYRGISKLLPGAVLTVTRDVIAGRILPEPEVYWDFLARAAELHADPRRFSDDDAATDALESVLGDAISSQMLSDVPLGAFLSGGIDSSVVVALMQARSRRRVQTFSIGFHEAQYNEAEHAMRVARHVGTDHTELYVDDAAALAVIPDLPKIYCEPFADSSQIPTYLVAKLARTKVTVSLSGDAGDELFGGYGRYFLATKVWKRIGPIPAALRQLAASGLRAVPPPTWDAVLSAVKPLLPDRARRSLTGDRLHKGAGLLEAATFDEMCTEVLGTYWPKNVVLGSVQQATGAKAARLPKSLAPIERMMARDAVDYLPNDILVKVDRAAMAVGLETRVPMLSRAVVEFALALPLHLKVRNGEGKWILRRVLDRHVPRELTDRPKMGFGIPIESWLRGPLKDWAEDLLDPARLRSEGHFDVDMIQRRWVEHQSGQRNWHYPLWPVLMFEAWLRAERT